MWPSGLEPSTTRRRAVVLAAAAAGLLVFVLFFLSVRDQGWDIPQHCGAQSDPVEAHHSGKVRVRVDATGRIVGLPDFGQSLWNIDPADPIVAPGLERELVIGGRRISSAEAEFIGPEGLRLAGRAAACA